MFNPGNIFTEYPDLVTTKELMGMLHIGKTKVYKLLNSNEIKSVKIGKTGRIHYIPKVNIIEYLNQKLN